MKQLYKVVVLLSLVGYAQPQNYYNGINFNNLTGNNLQMTLAQLISNVNTTYTYGDVTNDFLTMELDPSNSNNILLTYGWVDNLSCSSGVTDRRIRNKNNFGGSVCDYNREHVFSRSNANPTMGVASSNSTGISADPHNLRATDVQRNSNRGNKKFATGSGNSGTVGSGNWYPGDEWRGDIARIMMYMYVRYGNRCLPEYNAVGPKQGSTDMLQILLQWNIDDPVSQIEDNRNAHLETSYGNRNPFIDNPYLATLIWGGNAAQDRWGTLSKSDYGTLNFDIHPNPTKGYVKISSVQTTDIHVTIYNVLGAEVYKDKIANGEHIKLSDLKNGIFILKLKQGHLSETKRLIKF